jgi:hypothetical protein
MKKPRFVLPVGEAVYPHLTTPDSYQPKDKKGKPKGEPIVKYKIALRYDSATLEEIRKKLLKAAEFLMGDEFDPDVKLPIKERKVGKDGEKELLVEAASGADYKPALFDAKLNRLPTSVSVGGGSKVKADVTASYYEGFGGGINLYLNGVQVLELQSAPESLFDSEDGFEFSGSGDSDEDSEEEETTDAGSAFHF